MPILCHNFLVSLVKEKKGNLSEYPMKHSFPNSLAFEPAKRQENRANYDLGNYAHQQ